MEAIFHCIYFHFLDFDLLHKSPPHTHTSPNDFLEATKARMGVAVQAWGARARAGRPEDFCSQWSLQKTIQFSFKIYGEHASHVMAQEWCHRMQFFYNRWEDEGAVDEAAALEYQSTHEFVTLARTATGDLKARCDWLSSFCPKWSASSSHRR